MIRKPNIDINFINERGKKNQINRKFNDIFSILFDPNYYEGTEFGKFYKEINDKGKSKVYVEDPLEKSLDEIMQEKGDIIKYLVGFTGIGKTTLLRNYFGIFSRDVKIKDESLIIYISFYYANLSSDKPQKSVEDEIIKYYSRAIQLLCKNNLQINFAEYSFWEGFYNFIEHNKPTILAARDLVPDISIIAERREDNKKGDKKENIIEKLQNACKENRIDYYASLLKYILKDNSQIKNIIFIYDDIESKEGIFHRPLVEVARHIHSCFSTNRDINVKTIVSLRAYTYRSNIDRQLEARRESVKNNTILKREAVNPHDIFEKRFNYIKEYIIKDADKKAEEQLFLVENEIERKFGKFVLPLVNMNLCHAMQMYYSILTNVRWISVNEQEIDGKFKVNALYYRLTAETIFKAVACGEKEWYSAENNKFFPNILHNDKKDTDLLGLYVIRYMLHKNADDLYGERYIDGDVIINEITNVFVSSRDLIGKKEIWQSKLFYIVQYFHNEGVLLRSIYDIENLAEEQIERKYEGRYKLYLSPRGKCLYWLLPQNALLLELYRDDIVTDLVNNDKLTSRLTEKETLVYLLQYVKVLFEHEKGYIRNAGESLNQYQEYFGEEFITAMVLEGIIKNIKSYYPDRDAEYHELNLIAKEIVLDMSKYIRDINREYGVLFRFSEYLDTYFHEE